MKTDKPAESLTTKSARKLWLALMLAVVAGYVDAFGYVTLLTFTSHMSGNSVAMVAYLAHHQWPEAIRRAAPIPAFVVGVFAAAMLGTFAGRNHLRRRHSILMGLELVLLVAFALYMRPIMRTTPLKLPTVSFLPGNNGTLSQNTEWDFWIGSVILAVAMGVQSTALRQVRGNPVHTAYITGMLAHLSENLAQLLFDRKNFEARQIVLMNAGIWCAFVAGGACGAFGELRWGLAALAPPVSLLAVLIICDLVSPVHDD